MKTKFLQIITLLTMVTTSYAQQGINYKAVLTDNSGAILANQNVTVEFAIIEIEDNSSVYRETHVTTTDANGIVILNIGEGTPISGSGDYSTINWRSDEQSLGIRVDTGSGFVNLGATAFRHVPYALNVTGLEALDEGNGIGWRLRGKNPNNYGNIGLNAVDLSHSTNYFGIYGASGTTSTAMGRNTQASGSYSTAMGLGTLASGSTSTAMGSRTEASGTTSTAMGRNTQASGSYSTAMGRRTTASEVNATAMGYRTEASGSASTAMGYNTTASLFSSTAMGYNTTASERSSTAMGSNTTASGINSTAMGWSTTASGNTSTAIGWRTTASGYRSTAMGWETEASGNISTAMGYGTRALSAYETVIGRYNVDQIPNSTVGWNSNDPLFVVGIGTSNDNRDNAFTILKNGDIYVGGNLAHNSDRRLKTKIKDLSYGLKEILQLQPKEYFWKAKPEEQKPSLGLIAQEVRDVIDTVVHEAHDHRKTLSVSYTELIPVLINAIKEQHIEIEQQRAKITQLQSLNNRVAQLEMALKNNSSTKTNPTLTASSGNEKK